MASGTWMADREVLLTAVRHETSSLTPRTRSCAAHATAFAAVLQPFQLMVLNLQENCMLMLIQRRYVKVVVSHEMLTWVTSHTSA